MGLRLVIEDMEGATTIVPLEELEVTIGRKDHNTIQLTEQNVSRSHARLKLEEDNWLVEDLSSYNGVKVNGVPIGERTPLREGDLLQIGDYHLKLTDDVERETIDLGSPRVAANQGAEAKPAGASAGAGPMMVSSSAELPAMSPAELARAADGTSSGPGSAVHDPGAEDEETKSKAGIIIGVLVGAILLVGGGVYAMSQSRPGAGATGGDGAVASAGAGAEKNPDAAGEKAEAGEAEELPLQAEAAAEESGPVEGGESDAPLPGEGGAGEQEPPEPELVGPGEGGEVAPEPEGEPGPEPPKGPKKKKKKKKAEQGGDVPPPPKPAVDANQLLTDARKASLAGDAAKAYELASQSYKAKKSSKALQLMVVNACNMGSKSKAVAAFKKMNSSKDVLKSHCASKGIDL